MQSCDRLAHLRPTKSSEKGNEKTLARFCPQTPTTANGGHRDGPRRRRRRRRRRGHAGGAPRKLVNPRGWARSLRGWSLRARVGHRLPPHRAARTWLRRPGRVRCLFVWGFRMPCLGTTTCDELARLGCRGLRWRWLGTRLMEPCRNPEASSSPG